MAWYHKLDVGDNLLFQPGHKVYNLYLDLQYLIDSCPVIVFFTVDLLTTSVQNSVKFNLINLVVYPKQLFP
jgi:hypothetical protein